MRRSAPSGPRGVLEVDWPFFGEICRAAVYTPPPSGKLRHTIVYAHATAAMISDIAPMYSPLACPV